MSTGPTAGTHQKMESAGPGERGHAAFHSSCGWCSVCCSLQEWNNVADVHLSPDPHARSRAYLWGPDHSRVLDRVEQLLGWWKRRHQEDVLLMFYDNLKEDHAWCVRKIATFMGVNCTDEVIARVVKTSHPENWCPSTPQSLMLPRCHLH